MKLDLSTIGCALATCLALTPAQAAVTLFDNGVAKDKAGTDGGTGYNTNKSSDFQVYDNFIFDHDSTIESVHFTMAGGTEPFEFFVYADDDGKPGGKIFSLDLNDNPYVFGPPRDYLNFSNTPDIGHDFSFVLDPPLTLSAGSYWVSFLGTGTNLFRTLGTRTPSTGPGDGFVQRRISTGQISNLNQRGDTAFKLLGQVVRDSVAAIDIKPGSDDNPINPRSKGVIPVAVLTSNDFDAQQIDVTSVVFGPNGATPKHNGHIEDVNNDGLLDMLFHFRTKDTGIKCGDIEAFLSGTAGGQSFSNFDSITTVGCGNDETETEENIDLEGILDEVSGSGAGAMDWPMLPGLGTLALLVLYRRRTSRS